MLRAAIVEKSKEHREYIRASLTGINMDIQVSEYADEYDYLDDLNEDASSFDILLLNTTIHREGDGLELAAKVRARSRKVMICFYHRFPEVLCGSFFRICYRVSPLSF